MFSGLSNAILNSDILPAVNSTFWSGLGNVFVFIGSWLLQGLASIFYTICKFALGLIDFMQFLVQKLIGLDVWMNLEKLDLNHLEETDVVFRFLLNDTVLEVFKTMFVVFLVLLVVFTIVGIIKNEYANATNGGDKLNDHKKVWFTAGKAIITVILVPFVLIAGILASNAILASLAKAFNINGNLTLGGQIFVASAYDASSYRYYANQGVRKYTSNVVNFNANGVSYVVNSALEPIQPNSFTENTPFTGYMFTYDGSEYYLWQCSPTEAADYYYYIKYILGAYVVEQEPERSDVVKESVKDYNTNFTQSASIEVKVKAMYNEVHSNISEKQYKDFTYLTWEELEEFFKNGTISSSMAYVTATGFMSCSLEYDENSSVLINAAYNTWSYNQVLQTNISSWGDQNLTLDTYVKTVTTRAGTMREVKVINNSDSWGKLHDGGKYGFSPLSVEYLVMADVIDFMIENDVTLYYVNAGNSNINYLGGDLDQGTLHADAEIAGSGIPSELLVDYKQEGRVSYSVSRGVNSELDGANYIVCYYDHETSQYIPLVNNKSLIDAKGNKYTFKSSQYNSDYNGVVIARAMFKNSNQARNCEPTYITTTMVVDQKGTDFDSKLATAVNLDYIDNYSYTYLQKLTNANTDNVWIGNSYNEYNYTLQNNVLTLYIDPAIDETTGNNIENTFEKLQTDLVYSQAVEDPITGEISYEDQQTQMGEIVERVQEIIKNNLSDADSATEYTYNLVSDSASADNHIITFKIYRESYDNPQYHTVTLTLKTEDSTDPDKEFKSQELVDIADGKQLCKVVFDVKISLDGSEQELKLTPNVYTPNAVVENGDLYTNLEGNILYFYLEKDALEKDKTFYGENAYNESNLQMLAEKVVSSFVDSNDAGSYIYKMLTYSVDYTKPESDTDDRRLTFEIYRAETEESSYTNIKKYLVNLWYNSDAETDVIVGEEPNTTTYRVHQFTVEIKEFIEQPVLAEYNDNISRQFDNSTDPNVTPNDLSYGVYNRENVLYYYNTAQSMLSVNTIKSATSIAEGFALLINGTDTSTDPYGYKGAELLDSTVKYTGAVEFGINYVGNLKVEFDAKVTNNDDNYYLIHVTATIKDRMVTDVNVGTVDEPIYIYQYIFDYSYSIYNTFYAYMDNKDLSSPIRQSGNNQNLVFTILDMQKQDDAKSYLVEEDVKNSENNKYQSVVQYTYKQVFSNSATTYTFNGVKTGVKCDNGVEFITLKSGGKFDQIGENAEDYDESKLIFTLGRLRAIYMPEYSSIVKHADGKYTYCIVDTSNVSPEYVYLYTVTINPNATGINITNNNGTYTIDASNPVTAYKYTTDGNYEEDVSKQNVAAQYILDHFKLDTFHVDMQGYQELVRKDVEGAKTRYTAVLESNTGNVIALTSTDIYFVDDSVYNNFNKYLLQAEIDGTTYRNATQFDQVTDVQAVLSKFLEQPVSVVFCRDEMSNMHWVWDMQIRIWSQEEGFHFLWRSPKLGFATVQSNDAFKDGSVLDNVVLTLSRGEVDLDYNFEGNVALGNVYLVTDLNWIIFIFAIVLIFSILGKAVWGLISRIYQITLLFMIMPAVASTLPIDAKGSRFENWKNQIISQVLGAYGVTIGLNFFFILIPVIREASAIFTDADLVGVSSTLKLFVGSADRLNYICYILFLLVAFTLLKTVPSLVQNFVGFKDGEVIKQGEDTKKNVTSTVEEAGKTISGKNIVGAYDNMKKTFNTFSHPGSEIIGRGKGLYDAWSAKRDARKKEKEDAVNEVRKQQNIAEGKENVKDKMDQAAERMQEDAQRNAEATTEQQNQAINQALDNANDANVSAESAQVADGLTPEATEQVAEEVASQQTEEQKAVNDAQRYAEASKLYAEAAQESANIATGDVHDYVGDRERAEAEAKEQEKEQEKEAKKYSKSREGRAEAAADKAEDAVLKAQEKMEAGKGKGVSKLSAEDIDAFNERHKNDENFVELVGKGHADYKSKKQKIAREQAKQEKYLEQLVENADKKRGIAEDAQRKIYRGIGGSFVRKFLSGEKTTEQKIKETELERKLANQLGVDRKEKAKIEAIFNETDPAKAKSWKTLEKMKNQLMQTEAGKKAAKEYDFYIKSEGDLGRKGMAVRREALERMRVKAMNIANDKIEDTTAKLNKAKDAVADSRSGAMHFVGKNAKQFGQVLASKGSAVFTAIRDSSVISGILGSSDTAKERVGQLVDQERKNREGLRSKALEDYKEFKQAKDNANEDKIRKDVTDSVLKDKGTIDRIAKYLQSDKHLANISVAQEEYRASMKEYRDRRRKGDYDGAWQALQNAVQSGKLNGTRLLYAFEEANGDLASGKLKNVAEATKQFQKTYQNANQKKILADVAAHTTQSTRDKMFGNAIDRAVADEQRKRNQDLAIKQKKYEASKADYKNISEQIDKHYGQFTKTGLIPSIKKATADYVQEKQEKSKIKQEIKTAKKIAKQEKKDSNNIKLQASKRASASAEQIVKASQKKALRSEKTIERILSERESQARKALIQELDKKSKNSRLSADSKADLAKLVKKMRANETLTDAERKRITQYANITASRAKVKAETATAKKAENAKTAAALEARAKAEYAKLLQKELESAKLESKLVNKIVNKIKQTSMTPSQVAKMTKGEVEKAIKDKQAEFMARSGKSSANSKELISEINQLKSLVSKLKATDSTYKVSLRKLKESNRKLAKQVKEKKSKDALDQSRSTKNSFGPNASGKN